MDTTPPSRVPRRMKIILGLSLALNLAVVGLIAGAVWRHEEPRGGARSAGFGAYGLPYMIALPRAERRVVIGAVRAGREAGVPDRAARRALYGDVLAALQARPFDPTALSAALGRQTEATLQVQEVAQGAWLAVITGMTDADRADYAQQIEEVLRRGPRPRK